MHREITDHKVNPANDTLTVEAVDMPGAGGASHVYRITFHNAESRQFNRHAFIEFQQGPINEYGVNGLTQEVLLAIVADRLRSFQAGQYACRENALALTKIEEAMHWLHARTRARMARGVEGTSSE